MKAFTSIAASALIALLCGCGDGDTPAKDAAVKDAPAKDAAAVAPKDTPDIIKSEIMANMKTLTAIMESVTDEASAKAAIPKIEAVRAKMRGVAARARKVMVAKSEMNKPPTPEDIAVMTALQGARAKLDEKPELLEILTPALLGMENDM